MPEGARLALYRLGPVTRGLRSALNRAAPQGVRPVQIAAGDLEGKWLLLDLQVDKDLWLGTYEPDVAAAVRRLAPAGSTAYDLGANLGYTSLLLAGAVGPEGRVLAFEPFPENVRRLREAVALNGLEHRVEVIETAVGDRDGRGTFKVHPSGSMGRLTERGSDPAGAPTVEVDVVRLDSFVTNRGAPAPLLVKIDLEGGEVAALRGMPHLLRESQPILLIELHGAQVAAEALAELSRLGYRAWTLGPDAPRPVSVEDAARHKHVVARPEDWKP